MRWRHGGDPERWTWRGCPVPTRYPSPPSELAPLGPLRRHHLPRGRDPGRHGPLRLRGRRGGKRHLLRRPGDGDTRDLRRHHDRDHRAGHRARPARRSGNKGFEAAVTAIEMAEPDAQAGRTSGTAHGLARREPRIVTRKAGSGSGGGLDALGDRRRGRTLGLLHLEALEAGGADPLAPGGGAFLDADLLEVGVPCGGASPSASGCARCRSWASFRTNNRLSPRNFSCARIPVEFGDPGRRDSRRLRASGGDCTRLSTVARAAKPAGSRANVPGCCVEHDERSDGRFRGGGRGGPHGRRGPRGGQGPGRQDQRPQRLPRTRRRHGHEHAAHPGVRAARRPSRQDLRYGREEASKAVGEGRADGRQGQLGGDPLADDPGRLRGRSAADDPSTPKPSPPASKGRASGPTPPFANRSRARCLPSMKDAARAAREAVEGGDADLAGAVVGAARQAAHDSVRRTPELLAGVARGRGRGRRGAWGGRDPGRPLRLRHGAGDRGSGRRRRTRYARPRGDPRRGGGLGLLHGVPGRLASTATPTSSRSTSTPRAGACSWSRTTTWSRSTCTPRTRGRPSRTRAASAASPA